MNDENTRFRRVAILLVIGCVFFLRSDKGQEMLKKLRGSGEETVEVQKEKGCSCQCEIRRG